MVHIVQLLCPARHCIIALAYEEEQSDLEQCKVSMVTIMWRMKIAHHCGICGSGDLKFEERRTPFPTMAAAGPALYQTEMENMATRAALDAAGATYDQQQRN